MKENHQLKKNVANAQGGRSITGKGLVQAAVERGAQGGRPMGLPPQMHRAHVPMVMGHLAARSGVELPRARVGLSLVYHRPIWPPLMEGQPRCRATRDYNDT